MKNLSKIFLLIISLGNFIYPSYKDKPLPNLPKEHRKPDQSKPLPTPFFIFRFQSTGDKKADKELEQMLNDRFSRKEKRIYLNLLYLKEGARSFEQIDNILAEEYFNQVFKIDQDIIIPLPIFRLRIGYYKDGFPFGYDFHPEAGKKYILRNRDCSQAELKNNFKQVEFGGVSHFYSREYIEKKYFCLETQDLKEQQKKLKEELEKALPDMPVDLRNIIQGYVGTDIT